MAFFMKRDALGALDAWSENPLRAPLIIKGARQVGKSWLVQTFGRTFQHYVEINFEKNKVIRNLFQGDIQIARLLETITLYTGKPIIPGKTLLFLDEIQECPEAIIYLRYFKEELPALHVIAAGSLIEFALRKVGVPVGRVDYLYLTPLSFAEFLEAASRADLRAKALNVEHNVLIDSIFHDLLRTYLWLGGMPEVVQAWIELHDIEKCQSIQDRLITSYKDDFHKYARKNQVEHVAKLFMRLPQQLGQKFTFSHVDPDLKASILKNALQLLEQAGIVHLSYYSGSYTLPLAFGINEKFFKVFLLDLGLVQRMLGFKQQDWMVLPMKPVHLGGLAEQFVAQELIAYQSKHTKAELFYWQRDAKNSQAEIDFLIGKDGHPIPIEVKSGKTGRLKSLNIYLNTHPQIPYGVKISEGGFERAGRILEIPLYGIAPWLQSTM